MKTFIARILRNLLSTTTAIERTTFEAVAIVPLEDWDRLDEATVWCADQWREHGLQYRRQVHANCELALFSFSDATHAVEFKLKFGCEAA